MSSRIRGLASVNFLTEHIQRHLNFYSAAAVTAGVSLLALAQPAEGSVVVTKTNIQIDGFNPAFIDFNKDGINDVELVVNIANYDHSFYWTFAAIPLNGGKVMGGNRGALGPYASAVTKGANIGPSAHFSSSQARGQITMERLLGSESASIHVTYYGKWVTNTPHYLGVKFIINGQTHYGWVMATVSSKEELSGTVTEYAYETEPNKKIGAGATSDTAETAKAAPVQQSLRFGNGPSIGMLALGADALPLWRREQDQCVRS
ncbi:MAG TPA: hypothetical protein VHW45_00960 [Candidatus Sulfotelmatobacter sp.]|jgi:hypothetical protein|nr:hypothetical protein [Candidatus Sulfotelmatobacter sp.]